MAMRLDKVVPWGRSKAEYFAMFNLDDSSLQLKILGCGDGPASFNAEMTGQGGSVVSFDPIYSFSGHEIKTRFDETAENVLEQMRASPDKWVWKFHKNPDELRANRVKALERFLADYDQGKIEARYLVAEFPRLPFGDDSFDLALCSHFLFLYSKLFSEEFHLESVREMCRVAKEILIFPLLTLEQKTSPYLEAVCKAAAADGHTSEICDVEYELQRGGNKMLRLSRKS